MKKVQSRSKKWYCLLVLVLFSPFNYGQDYEKSLTQLEDKAYAHFYSHKDSAYFYFDKIKHLALDNNKVVTAIDNLNYVCFSAGYFYDLQKIKSTITEIDELINRHSSVLDTLPDRGEFQKNYLNFNKGIYFHKLEDFGKAAFYFESLAEQISSKPDYQIDIDKLDLLSQSYSFIAQMNAVQGRKENANRYYENNIRLFKKFRSDDLEGLHKVNNLYANSLFEEKKLEKAKNLWLDSYDFMEKTFSSRNRNSLVTTGLLLSEVYTAMGKIDSAYIYLDKTRKYRLEDDPFTDRFFTGEAGILTKEMRFTDALKCLKNALNASLPSNKARVWKKIGNLHLLMGSADDALKSYQKGLGALAQYLNSEDYSKNPDPTTTKQRGLLLNLLVAKAKVLGTRENIASKKLVLNTLDTGLEVLDLLKPTFKNQTDKLKLIEDAFELFETGFATGYQLYEENASSQLIDTLFTYSEKSKSVLLLEAILASKATKFSNIPVHLVERENQIKSEITYLEKQLNQKVEQDLEKRDQLFELQEEHKKLIGEIEANYKSYFDLKYNSKTFSLTETQKLLKSDEKLISYFYGNEAIYAISVDKNSKHIERIPLDASLENTIKDVHGMLSDPKSDISVLSKKTYQLHLKLVAPFTKSKNNERLIICTDGLLNYIPFGALNTQGNGLSYLMESHAISYSNSATLYGQLQGRKLKDGKLLAFAPEFSGEQIRANPSRDKLLPLPHNKREVKQILKSFPGQSFIDENASLKNFTSQISEYGLLHLATHAVFDDTAPEFSYLAFSTVADSESLLYVSDLYNLRINADLITLSACESGIGELKRGEGFLSLARGFFYSGASSIASTLWKINDASTTALMDSFYQNLAECDTKDLALQNAKKAFLNTNKQNGLSHPYYWSGFIISGNTESLTSPNYWVWIGLGILLSIVAGFLVFRRKED